MKRILSAVIFSASLILSVPLPCAGGILTFEGFADGTDLVDQYAGVVFRNTMIITAGESLNEFEFPPYSGVNAATDSVGPVDILFDSPIQSFGAYFTYTIPIRVTAYDDASRVLGVVFSSYSNNLQFSGQPGSFPNELLELRFAGIAEILIQGAPLGGSFVFDNLRIDQPVPTNIPEPSSFSSVVSGACALLLGWAVRRAKRLPGTAWLRRNSGPVRAAPALLCLGIAAVSSSKAAGNVVAISPGQDINAIVQANPAGSAFFLNSGTHRLAAIIPKDDDSFAGAPDAVLNGSRILTGFTREGSYWVASGLKDEPRPTGECASGSPTCVYPQSFFIDGQPLTHVATLQEVRPGAFFFDYAADRIYFADDPARRLVELATAPFAFSGGASRVIVRGLTVEKYANAAQVGAIDDGGVGWLIENNVVRLNHGTGIRFFDNAMIRENQVLSNGQLGIGGFGAGVRVVGNEIARNTWAGFSPGWEAGGTKFVRTTDLVLRDNYVHHNTGPGLWIDIDNIRTLIANNVAEYNTKPGIQHEISYAAKIQNNVVRWNGITPLGWLWAAQILIQNSQDTEVSGNVVETGQNYGEGITMIQQDRGSGAYGPYLVRNNYVHDNHITYLGSFGLTGAAADFASDLLFSSNNRFDFNHYYAPVADGHHWVWDDAMRTWTEFKVEQEHHGTFNAMIGNISLSPAAIPSGVLSTVRITASITNRGLIASSVSLKRVDETGGTVAVLGMLHDDGLDGDAVAGDHVFSGRVQFLEPGPALVRLQISAAILGVIQRVESEPVVLLVRAPTGR